MSSIPIQLLSQAPAPGGNPLAAFMPFLLIVGIFYFMMIRPQQRKDKERRRQIEELRAGSRVLFSGGILGKIVEARQATFLVEVAEGLRLEIARGAVNRILQEGEAASLDEAR